MRVLDLLRVGFPPPRTLRRGLGYWMLFYPRTLRWGLGTGFVADGLLPTHLAAGLGYWICAGGFPPHAPCGGGLGTGFVAGGFFPTAPCGGAWVLDLLRVGSSPCILRREAWVLDLLRGAWGQGFEGWRSEGTGFVCEISAQVEGCECCIVIGANIGKHR